MVPNDETRNLPDFIWDLTNRVYLDISVMPKTAA